MLLVEDEVLVALLMEELILELGAASVRMAPTVQTALETLRETKPDFAVLDVNLGGAPSYPVAEQLERLGVHFLFLTGYGPLGVDGRWQARTIVQKPATLEALGAGVWRASASGASSSH